MKFKRRKNMSLKKLEDERQNLVRVNDILSELEEAVGTSEKTVRDSERISEKKESLKTF